MSLVCAVTGEVPDEAVFCPKTNLIYEKRLIMKHIAATGCCPVSGAQLQQQDLLPIKTNPTVKPRPLSASSIPGLLSCLQTEWDSLMSEAFLLKTHLEQVCCCCCCCCCCCSCENPRARAAAASAAAAAPGVAAAGAFGCAAATTAFSFSAALDRHGCCCC
ncbi:hypothetical protein ETH_00037165, partial [Eimeria tenella]